MQQLDISQLLITFAGAIAVLIAYVEPRYRKLREHLEEKINADWEERIKLKDANITDLQTRLKDSQNELSYEQREALQFKEAADEAQKDVESLRSKLAIADETALRMKSMYEARIAEIRADFDTMAQVIKQRDAQSTQQRQLANLVEQLTSFLAKKSLDGQ